MKSILDKSFRYTDAASTDLAKTFARVKKQLREREERAAKAEAEQAAVVAQRRITNGSKA